METEAKPEMQILAVTNEKGGVGKTMFTCQFAFYCALKLGKRVLVVDFDHQGQASTCIQKSSHALTASITSDRLLTEETTADGLGLPAGATFVLVPSDRTLTLLEKETSKRASGGLTVGEKFVDNLWKFLDSAKHNFDICVIDTNPNPDVRMKAALLNADKVISPVQVLQEALDGIGALIEDITVIKNWNPSLHFIGILPNLIRGGDSLQKINLDTLKSQYGELLLRVRKTVNGRPVEFFGAIPHRTSISEAQQMGVPVWELPASTADKCYRNELEPVFRNIAEIMEGKHGVSVI
jgi:chromosome partitioning protein